MSSIKVTNVIVKDLYPIIEKAIVKNESKFMSNISIFLNKNHDKIYAIAPYDRIYFGQDDLDNLFKSLDLNEKDIINIIQNAFWWDIPYNPQCIKEPYVEVLLMIIRYYLIHNKQKNAEIVSIYLLFTGKFYASLHGLFFKSFPPSKYPEVMDYVVTNMLSEKFDLKKEGTIFGAIKALSITWLTTYGSKIKSNMDDEELGDYLQQLRDREKSLLKNVAKLYYEAYNNKYYLNYETDNLDEKYFRLADNDSAIASRITESSMTFLTSNYVSLDICNKCKDQNVKATEIKDIIESILGDNNNLPDVRKIINIIICDFMKEYPKTRVSSVEFIAYTIKAKPNTQNKYLLELKNTILRWLDENSPNYRKRKSRNATAISYYKAILTYFTLVISKVAQKIY